MNQRVEAFESISDGHCQKHPISSPIGVCAYCLNDRLLELQRSYRLSSLTEFESAGEEDDEHLTRSNSRCVEAKKGKGFWRIKDIFRKMIKSKKGEKSNFEVLEDQSGISGVSSSSRMPTLFSSAKISGFDDVYGSNRMELCGIYENYWDPKVNDFEDEETYFSTIEDDFIDLKLDLL